MSILKGIKTIVFDFGGVIVTLNTQEALRRFEALGVERPEQYLNHYCQQGPFRELEEGKIDCETFYNKIRTLTSNPALTAEEIDHAWLGFVADTPRYNIEMLENLRARGYRLLLLSNTNPPVMRWAHSAEFCHTGRPLSDYISEQYQSCKIGYMKPDAAIYQHMIDHAQLIPQETLFIDDAEANVKAAEALGIRTYQATNGEPFYHIFDEE